MDDNDIIRKKKIRRVSKACDNCKRRKYKCSGINPCQLCKKKNVPCLFSNTDKRKLTKAQRIAGSSSELRVDQPSEKAVSLSEEDDSIQSQRYDPNGLDGIQTLTNFEFNDLDSFSPNKIKDSGGLNSTAGTQDWSSEVNKERSEGKQQIYSEENSRILFDSVGYFCYIGDSSPLSLLTVCRDIFRDKLGKSKFTEDPKRIHIIENTSSNSNDNLVNLPTKQVCLELLNLFDENINRTYYVLNINHFKTGIVDFVYTNPLRAKKNHMALLYLVLALGLLFKELSFGDSETDCGDVPSECFFKIGFRYVKDSIDDLALWVTESNFLAYFYLQTSNKRNASWLALGSAIRHAQALGLHRKYVNESLSDKEYILHRRKLWRSLYIFDKASSILLGRPFIIHDYDWDDFTEDLRLDPNDLDSICLLESTKVVRINGRIIEDFYMKGIVEGGKAEKLASELKSWSNNLALILQINHVLAEKNKPCHYSLIFMHLSQLYGICLLTKPFLLYAVKNSIEIDGENSQLANFYQSSVKSAVLTIQLISFYLNVRTKRVESYFSYNCCFTASLVLGMTVVHLKNTSFQSQFKIPYIMKIIEKGKAILSYYGTFDVISKRYSIIISYLIEALGTPSTKNNANDFLLNCSFDHDLSSMQYFQNYFIPSVSSVETESHETQEKDDFSVFMYNFGANDFILNNEY